MTRTVAKWLVRFALFIPCFVLVLLLLLGGLLFTQTGLNLAMWGAQKALPQLTVEEAEGAILTGITLRQVNFKDPELFIDLQAKAVQLELNAECLFEPRVCVDNLTLESLSFALSGEASPAQEEPTPSEPLTEITLPIPVSINRVQLNDIALDVLGTEIQWKSFSTAVTMEGRVLTLHSTMLNDMDMTLAPTDANKKTETAIAEAAEGNTADIELPEVWIPLDVVVEGVEVRNFTLQGESPVKVRHFGLKAKASDHWVSIEKLVLDMPEVTVDASTEIELKGDYRLPKLALDAKLNQTELKGQTLSLKANGSVADLNLNADLGGVIKAHLEGSLKPLQAVLPFDLSLSQGEVQWPLTGEADYRSDIDSIDIKGNLDAYQLFVALKAQGKDLPDMELVTSAKGTLERVNVNSLVLKTLGGQVSGQVTADWSKLVTWNATLGLDSLQPGLQWPDTEGNISGSITTNGSLTEKGGWKVSVPLLAIQGLIRDYPLSINGQLDAEDINKSGEPSIYTKGVELSHGPNNLFVSGSLDKQWGMDVELNFPEFVKSIPELRGHMYGKVNLRGEFKEPQIKVDVSVNEVDWKQEVTVESVTLSGDISPLPAPKGDVSLIVKNVKAQDRYIENVDLQFSGTQEAHQLTLDVLSDWVSTSLKVVGGLTEKPEMVWKGELQRADITSEQGTWTLEEAAALGFNMATNLASVQAHCWNQKGASLCLTKDLSAGESGEANIAIKQFNFDQIKRFVPPETDLKGEVNASAWARWAPNAKPELTVSISLPEGQVTQSLDAPITVGWNGITLDAELENDTLRSRWSLDLTDNGVIDGQANINNVQSNNQTINGKLGIRDIHLGMLKPLLGEFSEADANIYSDLTFSGPLLHPKLKGDFVVEKLIAKGEITPVDVDEGRISVAFNGYDAVVSAKINTPDGTLNVNGDGHWADLKAWRGNLAVFAEELNVKLPPMVHIKVKPDLNISVTPDLAKIEGDIHLPWGRIEVEELPPSAVAVSSDEVLLDENFNPVEEKQPLPMNIQTNVNVKIGDDFRLSAFGLLGNLKGDLKVSQRDKGPFVVGEVNILNGSYRSFGQDLLIQKGKILMNGPVDQPYVAITAIRNPDNIQDDVTAGIRVDGPADTPQVSIFSDPAMPQANALSYLLRGRNIDAEAGGNLMATTLIGLSLAKSGKVVGEIGQAFGVQDLQLDTAGSGDDSQVTVSGYILPGLKVTYGVGIFNSLGEFTVRYRLMQDLYVEAVSGLGSAVDLIYQFEFD
ncbi:translocation/assembly module TamB [Vibrio sp. S9_S30]|uniref:autotransporter assembly complex protein TamB n=1 Tax=Vibrio sp. S9_S30 TaxID=2720226 RepID=UPI0016807B36|nr:translocation/assembly module TamB domain-containing protein [Vibrio sp. S9_S30]MBD1557250.1 translocation/assembly module TamB [Vibrio sp. S9_S30]